MRITFSTGTARLGNVRVRSVTVWTDDGPVVRIYAKTLFRAWRNVAEYCHRYFRRAPGCGRMQYYAR